MSSPRALLPLLGLALALAVAASAGKPSIEPVTELPQSKYFEVTRPDLRLCPAPFCGGFFVRLVNQRRLVCADGAKARECHAALLDWSALGLSEEDEAELLAAFGEKLLLVRGELELRDLGFGQPVPVLAVSDAWRSAVGPRSEAPARFESFRRRPRTFGVVPSGIVCVTHPCPSLVQKLLNRRPVRALHEIDLSRAGASPDRVEAGFEALFEGDGLLVFGHNERIRGPAGRGRALIARNFYLKVAGGDAPACGGLTFPPNPPCLRGEFCELPAGTCQIADLPGTCQEIPEACPAVIDPVCGCDGVTYGNDCERRAARVARDHPGACEKSDD